MYLPGGPRVDAKGDVGALEMAEIGVGVPLPLVRAFLASLFLPAEDKRLRQAHKPAI